MSNFIDKVKIKTGITKIYNHDLSCYHVTSQDFFRIRPIYIKECIPNEDIRVNVSSFVRLAPIQKPFYGSVSMINRAFFIPFRTIFKSFNEFYTDTEFNSNGQTYKVDTAPYFNTTDLVQTITSSPYATAVTNGGAYDVCVQSNGNLAYFKFTAIGRHLMTIINALGYTFPTTTDSNVYNINVNVRATALPIFAFAKVVSDWYTDSQYNSKHNQIERTIAKYDRGGVVDAQDLDYILTRITTSLYDKDYFTSAFDNPLVPNDGTMSSVTLPDIKDYSKDISTTNVTNATFSRSLVGDNRVHFDSSDNQTPPPYIEGKSNGGYNAISHDGLLQGFTYRGFVTMLNQYMLDSLKALSDYVKRYQLVGSRTLDRYMALFGIKLDSAKLNRSVYIGKSATPIDIADVMSTAETDSAVLGQYAAKGIGYDGNQNFSFHTDEFGYFVILNTIVPRVGYVQGMLRQNLHIDRFDFFQPDFDALGTQAIAQCELFGEVNTLDRWDALNGSDYNPNGVFGYSPRFSEYAVGRDFMSGDFRFHSLNVNMRPWHLNRMFDPTDAQDYEEVAHHDENFDIANNYQYNRIFVNQSDNADHFYLVHNFNVSVRSPKKPLYEQYDFDEGRSMVTRLGGTNLN